MSNPCNLLGFIEEMSPKYQADPQVFRRVNDAAIAQLPEDDPYPPLCRALFSVTGDDSAHGSFRGTRLIHFAGRFNHFDADLPAWLDKFEALLRRLFWVDAEIFFMNEWGMPPIVLKYRITQAAVGGYHANPPRLPQEWKLSAYLLENRGAPWEGIEEYLGVGRVLTPDV